MAAQIIDGRKISVEVTEELKKKVEVLKNDHDLQPGLAVVIIGDDPASHVYVNAKEKKANELGILSRKIQLPAETTQDEVLKLIEELNNDSTIHGILVQSPPPAHIDEEEIILSISVEKDVDCFHPYNVGRMLIGDENGFKPCTPHGCMVLMEKSGIDPTGKHAVIIGRSNIVGKPMAALLVQKAKGANATVTICHSRTQNMTELVKQADIVVAAIGKPNFVTGDMVKEGAVVLDVGINRVEDASKKSGFRLVGDVDFSSVEPKASWITPVPGGVGPMTIGMLMKNTIVACCNINKINVG
ncbi:MAG: bifunctional methylenetetrahydrofolate dehydrogenase/methenyltetrahydrofolate cyclohydrolase FolD [Lentisphaeraceae bacterium]|nr:bifunctional methylenetetrahydrofolate dehydrogenase/methenyltetrahydrofolate cyclohydrolase FolD [Lentisphaeraceae bacterium]